MGIELSVFGKLLWLNQMFAGKRGAGGMAEELLPEDYEGNGVES